MKESTLWKLYWAATAALALPCAIVLVMAGCEGSRIGDHVVTPAEAQLAAELAAQLAGVSTPTPDPRTAPPTEAPTEEPARPRPSATVTSAPRPTVTSAPAVEPPPFALSNGGDGTGNPPFTKVLRDQHVAMIDFTWWFYMGAEWRDRYACGGPNQNSAPCWAGGINSPCDPDHAAAWNGPCHRMEWATVESVGTIVTMSGPGFVPGSIAADDRNPFADVWFSYVPGLPVHAKYCPPANMTDRTTGQTIPIKGWFSASGCREVDFIAPAEGGL